MPTMRSWWVLLATLVGVGVTASAGRWQLSRADQKLSLHETMLARQQLAPLDNLALPCDSASWAATEQRPVRLSGLWQPQHTLFLDNRAMSGRAGRVVLTPLLLQPSPLGCAAQVVLVQRGWVPLDQVDRSRVPEVPTPTGLVTLEGRLVAAPSRLMELGDAATDSPGVIRQNVSLPALSTQWQQALRPGSIQQTGPSPEGLVRDWWQPSADVVKHQAYAAQWFAMAAIMAGLYVWFQWLKPRRGAAH